MKKTLLLLMMSSSFLMNAQSWSLNGNAGTTPGTNFIGTTDNKDLVFKTNNYEKMRISSQDGIMFTTQTSTFNMKNGRPQFSIDEYVDAFTIYNNPNDYTHFRVDSFNLLVYLQEDIGKVVIGSKTLANCSTCTDYKLFVKDGIKTEKVKVEIAAENGWADYVFDKEYNLMPLHELDKFITENRHLPEVPTTEEAIRDGIELKEMNILLLKKVEELTLHVIEQNKKLEKQQKQMEELSELIYQKNKL